MALSGGSFFECKPFKVNNFVHILNLLNKYTSIFQLHENNNALFKHFKHQHHKNYAWVNTLLIL